MKQSIHPAAIAGILVAVVALLGFFLFKGTGSGPAEGTKDTLPAAMRNAYGGGATKTPSSNTP